MKQLQRLRQIFRLPLHVYLLYLLVVTFLFSGVSLSRYVTTDSGGDSGRVAAGVVAVSSDTDHAIQLGPNNAKTDYCFTVSNVENGQCSEVVSEYDVTVKLLEAMPAGVSMQFDNQIVNIIPGKKTYFFDNVGTLPAATEVSHEHILSFSADDMAALTANSLTVTVTVQATQIDSGGGTP